MSPASRSATLSAALLWLSVKYLAAVLLVASACSQSVAADWKSWFGFGQPRIKESKYPPPARLAILWSPAMYNEVGKSATRGFGGRVYFYDAKNKPIAVEGQLVVYAYDNNKPHVDSRVPDRKFAFTPEQFTQHYSPTEMGASYSIWVPWDAIGQPQADISLVPIFTSSSGALVMGQPSRNMLPGPNTPQTVSSVVDCTLPAIEIRPAAITGDPTHRDGVVQQVAYQQQAANQAAASQFAPNLSPGQPELSQQGGVSTMSMTLPGSLADRLAQAPPQMTLYQKMAMLRQEAMAKQAGYAPPTLVGNGLNGGTNPTPPNSAASAAPKLPTPSTTVIDINTPKVSIPQAPAASPWSPPPTPQPARSVLPQPPALGGLTLPQVVGPPPSQPVLAAQPSYLPGSPQLGRASSSQAP
jgi:hypothetical protein